MKCSQHFLRSFVSFNYLLNVSVHCNSTEVGHNAKKSVWILLPGFRMLLKATIR